MRMKPSGLHPSHGGSLLLLMLLAGTWVLWLVMHG